MIDLEKVKKLALENGFKLKEQANGNLDLNSYVYAFAEALLKDKEEELNELKQKLAKVESGEFVIVPKEPTRYMVEHAHGTYEGAAVLPYSFYKAMIEAAQENRDER